MWLVRAILTLLIVLVLTIFFTQNSGQSVDLRFLGWEGLGLPLYLVLLVSCLAGMLVALLLCAVRELRLRARLRRLERTLREKDSEIADLRTLPLRDMGQDEQGA